MGLANQSVTPGRTSLLQAVNVLLEGIGEQPVSSLENEQVGDARTAERTLLEFHKDGQLKGWCWNTEQDYEFVKNAVTNQIVVPENIARFSPDPYAYAGRFQLRGQTVYDKLKRTSVLEASITSIWADVVWLLPWDQVPETYNRWTTIRSARVFAARVLGDDSLVRYTLQDERDAQTALERIEQQSDQPNMLTGSLGYLPFPTYAPASGLTTRRISAGIQL